MLQSMTGYGEAIVDNIHCEIKTLNHRFFDVNINLPSSLSPYEFKIRSIVKKYIERGAVILKIYVDSPQYKIDVKGAEKHYKFIRQLNKILGNNFEISVDSFLAFKKELPPAWKMVEKALTSALLELVKTRKIEGKKLEKDIKLHLKYLKRLFSAIKKQAPKPEERKNQFKEKLATFAEKTVEKVEGHKLLDEFAFLLMKEDFNEEQIRFETHLKAFEKNINSKNPSGKYLVFLTQEMHRETNTIASKVKNSDVSQLTVKLKNELEKIREQVENAK